MTAGSRQQQQLIEYIYKGVQEKLRSANDMNGMPYAVCKLQTCLVGLSIAARNEQASSMVCMVLPGLNESSTNLSVTSVQIYLRWDPTLHASLVYKQQS